jgi:hypothetical protein
MTFQRPSTAAQANGSSSSSVQRGQLLQPFSELWDFLTMTSYGDGKPRQPGHLSLRVGFNGLQVTLTDPSSRAYCCMTQPTLDDAFLALEIGLKDGSLAWRPSNYSGKGR